MSKCVPLHPGLSRERERGGYSRIWAISVCAAPWGMIALPVWSNIGYRVCTLFLVSNREWFLHSSMFFRGSYPT